MSNVWIDRIFIENTGEKLIHFSEDDISTRFAKVVSRIREVPFKQTRR